MSWTCAGSRPAASRDRDPHCSCRSGRAPSRCAGPVGSVRSISSVCPAAACTRATTGIRRPTAGTARRCRRRAPQRLGPDGVDLVQPTVVVDLRRWPPRGARAARRRPPVRSTTASAKLPVDVADVLNAVRGVADGRARARVRVPDWRSFSSTLSPDAASALEIVNAPAVNEPGVASCAWTTTSEKRTAIESSSPSASPSPVSRR